MPHPIFTNDDEGRHPTVTVAIGISYRKQDEDYAFFADKIRIHLKAKTLVYGTDGEPALEKAMEGNFPIESKSFFPVTMFIHCSLHFYLMPLWNFNSYDTFMEP